MLGWLLIWLLRRRRRCSLGMGSVPLPALFFAPFFSSHLPLPPRPCFLSLLVQKNQELTTTSLLQFSSLSSNVVMLRMAKGLDPSRPLAMRSITTFEDRLENCRREVVVSSWFFCTSRERKQGRGGSGRREEKKG